MESRPSQEDLLDEPILVTRVDYCLLCGQIAVLYDLAGNIMKREMVMGNGSDVTYQDLFDHLCTSLGLRKNSKLKRDWNFYTGPFPFCVECEEMMHSLAEIYRKVEELHGVVKMRMTEGEDKYVSEELYRKQDYRYLEFRKEALGEQFRGDTETSFSRRRSRRQSKLKIESTTSIVTEVKEEEIQSTIDPTMHGSSSMISGKPATKMATSSKEPDVLPTYLSECTNDNDEHDPIIVSSTIPKNALDLDLTSTERRRSVRIRNKMQGDSSHSEGSSLAAEVYTENFDTGCAVKFEDIKEEASEEIEMVHDGRTRSRRGRKRKREPDTCSILDEENKCFNSNSGGRGGVRIKSAYDEDDDWTESITSFKGRRGRKKRGSSSLSLIGIKKEAVVKNKAEMKDIDEEDWGLGNKESYMIAPLVKDPLSGNIYYRTILFVWIREENCFQCSTCSVFIPNNENSVLKMKFYKHFIMFHSDRFKCRLCPECNQFQSDLELHQHFRQWHPGFHHVEPDLRLEGIQKRTRNAVKTEPRKFKNFHLQPCTICLKPINPRDEHEVEEHRLSHMNTDEINTYLKNKDKFDSTRKTRKSPVKIQGQFTTSSWIKCAPPGVSSTQSKACPICGKSGIDQDQFKKHRMSHMNKKEKTVFLKGHHEDKVADKEFRKRHYVKPVEMKIKKFVAEDLISEQFSCPDCGWRTASKDCFFVHMKHHQDQKKKVEKKLITSCRYPNCGQTFSGEGNLKQHVRKEHNDKQPVNEFMCKTCGRLYKNRQRLVTHETVHATVPNHYCQVCQKGFSSKEVLNDHLAGVHGEGGILTCPEVGCGAEFKAKYSFHSHMRKMHGISVKNQEQSFLTSSQEEQNTEIPASIPERWGSRREISEKELSSGMGFMLPVMQKRAFKKC